MLVAAILFLLKLTLKLSLLLKAGMSAS